MISIINPNEDNSYYVLPNGITITGMIKSYDTYEDMLKETTQPAYASVTDATGDSTVGTGGALYKWTDDGWVKIYETECMDQDDKFSWDNIIGGPTSTVDELDLAVTQSHVHENKDILDKLSVIGNKLAYNGVELADSALLSLTYDKTITNSTSIDNLTSISDEHTSQIQALLAQEDEEIEFPVTSVNGKTGAVIVTIDDIDTSSITDQIDSLTTAVQAQDTRLSGVESTYITIDVDTLTNYTTSTDLTTLLTAKADVSAVYTKSETDALIPDVSSYITVAVDNLTNYYDKDEVDDKVNTVAASVPTAVSQLDNDSGYITISSVPTDYYTKSEIDIMYNTTDTRISAIETYLQDVSTSITELETIVG